MAGPTYQNFDITIVRDGDVYVANAQSPDGEAVTRFTMPFSELELENFLLSTSAGRGKVRRIDTPAVAAAKHFGERLFTAAFGGEVGALLRSCLNEASDGESKLRLRLRLKEAPELADLPWEYLYNSSLNRFLALDNDTAIVRYLDLPERVRALKVTLPLRVLVAISDPSDYDRLDVEQEWSNLQEALVHLIRDGAVVLDRLEDATLPNLQYKLQTGYYHIFHFIGHGGFDQQNKEGVLILKDANGKGRMVSGQQIGWLLHNHKTLSLALINACEGARADYHDAFAGTAQSLVQQGIPAVVAMQFEITDMAAKTFARSFYTSIARSHPLEVALTETRLALFAAGHGMNLEWGTPVLYMRSPDGRIFDMQGGSYVPGPAEAAGGSRNNDTDEVRERVTNGAGGATPKRRVSPFMGLGAVAAVLLLLVSLTFFMARSNAPSNPGFTTPSPSPTSSGSFLPAPALPTDTEALAAVSTSVGPAIAMYPSSTPFSTDTALLLPTSTWVPIPTNTPVPQLTNTSVPLPTDTAVPLPTRPPAPAFDAVVAAAELNLREGPGPDYAKIGEKAYPEGTGLSVLAKSSINEWLKVRVPNGAVGWMSAKHLTVYVNINELEVAPAPPLPTNPPPTARPTDPPPTARPTRQPTPRPTPEPVIDLSGWWSGTLTQQLTGGSLEWQYGLLLKRNADGSVDGSSCMKHTTLGFYELISIVEGKYDGHIFSFRDDEWIADGNPVEGSRLQNGQIWSWPIKDVSLTYSDSSNGLEGTWSGRTSTGYSYTGNISLHRSVSFTCP
ncbi:MAG TPA: CHAT domain-containing protein [Chloroflexia bacterium]|jgi:hypothetical protein